MEKIINNNNLKTPLLFCILCENIELANHLKQKIINIMEEYPNINQLPFLTQNYKNTLIEQFKTWKNYKKNKEYQKQVILNYNILEGYDSDFTCKNKSIIQMLMFSRELKTQTFYINVIDLNYPLNIPKIYPCLKTNFDKIYLFKDLENFEDLTFNLLTINYK